MNGRGVSRRLQKYTSPHAVVVLGESGVGKSNMIKNFARDSQELMPLGPTVGVDYTSKLINLSRASSPSEAKTVKAQIWDTAGQ